MTLKRIRNGITLCYGSHKNIKKSIYTNTRLPETGETKTYILTHLQISYANPIFYKSLDILMHQLDLSGTNTTGKYGLPGFLFFFVHRLAYGRVFGTIIYHNMRLRNSSQKSSRNGILIKNLHFFTSTAL